MIARKNRFFIVGLLIALAIAFSVHVYLHSAYRFPYFGSFIIASYLFNAGFVLLEVWFLKRRQMKEGSNLGNVYLALSMFKFLVFFALFLPLFKMDGTTDHFEYFGFFIPYVICLAAGTSFLVKILKEVDTKGHEL